MDSLDAQALLVELMEGQVPLPALWWHTRAGALSFAFMEGGNTFTWEAEQVADMARRWRDSGGETPKPIRVFVDLHRRLDALVENTGRAPADVVIHDFVSREVHSVWEDDKLVVIVDHLPDDPDVHHDAVSNAS